MPINEHVQLKSDYALKWARPFLKRGVVLAINLFNALSQHFFREVRYLTRYRRQTAWKPSRHCRYSLVTPNCEQAALLTPNTTLFHHTLFVYFNLILFPANSTTQQRILIIVSEANHCVDYPPCE